MFSRTKRWLLPASIFLLVIAGISFSFFSRPRPVPAQPYQPGPVTATVWDEVGLPNRLVSTREADDWRRELNRGVTSLRRRAVLHLRMGEYELATRTEPARAEWHFRKVRQLTKPNDPLYGEAVYHQGVAQFYQCDYTHASKTFRALVDPWNGLKGFSPTYAALWLKHAEVCEGYHDSHAALGIPQPPRLDPECGAAALAMCRKVLGLPHDRKSILSNIRVTGRGSSNRDIVKACDNLGDVEGKYHRADPKTLKSLPKPLIAFVEHDHFVAVLKTDDTGITYSCSDCGAWPGGNVTLSWEQWKAMEASEVIAVSATPRGLAGFARSLSMMVVGQAPQDFPARNCGYDIESLRCQNSSSCPTQGGGQGQGGPGCPDPVNLSTLEEEFSPEPDLVIYNPTGPAVIWKRMYNSMRGNADSGNLSDPETLLGTGWSHPYNTWVRIVGDSEPRFLTLPNGSRIQFVRTGAATGTSPCEIVGGGQPIRIMEYRSTPAQGVVRYQWYIYHADGSVWTTDMVASNQYGYITANAYVEEMGDRNGNYIVIESDREHIPSSYLMVRDSAGRILFYVHAAPTSYGSYITASDCYGRYMFYVVEKRKWPEAPFNNQPYDEFRLLTKVSHVSNSLLQPSDYRNQYGYTHVASGGNGGMYCLSSHTVPSPTGTGTVTAKIRYQTNGTMEVKELEDANGSITRFTKVTTTKTKVEFRATYWSPNGGPTPPDTTTLITSYTSEYGNHMSETSRTDATNTQDFPGVLWYQPASTGFGHRWNR